MHLNLGCPPICLRRFGYVLSILRGGQGGIGGLKNHQIGHRQQQSRRRCIPPQHRRAAMTRSPRLLRCSHVNKYSSSSCRRCCLVITAAACRHRRRDCGAPCTAKVLATVNEDIVTTVPSITRIIVASLRQSVTCRHSYSALQFIATETATTALAQAGLQPLAVTSDRRKARPVETPTNKQAHAVCRPQDEARGRHLGRSRQACEG